MAPDFVLGIGRSNGEGASCFVGLWRCRDYRFSHYAPVGREMVTVEEPVSGSLLFFTGNIGGPFAVFVGLELLGHVCAGRDGGADRGRASICGTGCPDVYANMGMGGGVLLSLMP